MDFLVRYKRLFLIIGFVMTVIAIGYLLYKFFFQPLAGTPPADDPTATSTLPGSGLPAANTGTGGQVITGTGTSTGLTGQAPAEGRADPVAAGNVTKTDTLTQTPSLAPTLAGDGRAVQYYDQASGKFFRLAPNGQPEAMSDQVFHQVEKVVWSPDKNRAVLEYPDGANIIYDFQSKKQTSLPSHWKDFSYSPSGDRIVFKSMGQDPENRWLAVVSGDGSQVQGVETLGDKDDTVYAEWSPNNQVVALVTEGKDFDRQEVYFIGLNGENFKSTIVEGRGFEPQWSPSGNQLLYSVYSTQSDMKPGLWAVDAQGDQIGSNRRNLNVATWADKCNFASGSTVYCAVPRSLESGAGMFPELAQNTADDLYQIDIATGAKKRIAVPQGDYTINNLMVSEDQRYLYFSDSATNQLHKIQLK